MKAPLRFALSMSIAVAAVLCLSGIHQKLIPAITEVSAAAAVSQDQAPPPPDQGPDPASVNQAEPSGPSYTTQAPPPPNQAAPPDQGAPTDQNPEDYANAPQPTAVAPDAPPPLPDYDQPPPPADGYIWTPGYWAWAPTGYYWVPGAWVEPPYMGALWTPGYWGFYSGGYMFYPGHWGSHIGFYGGINYGFGYVGFGYEGGYWNSGRFFYNRAYNHIDVHVVHNVYEYHAAPRAFNAPRGNFDPHASFRGGAGVQVHPQPSEGAAWREPTAPRMSTQAQHEQNYSSTHGQGYSENHGRPSTPAISKPIPADRNVHPQPQSQSHSGGGGHSDNHHQR